MQATISSLLKIALQSARTGEYAPGETIGSGSSSGTEDCTAEHAVIEARPNGASMFFANLNKPSSDISQPSIVEQARGLSAPLF
jgi:hypothetical protein